MLIYISGYFIFLLKNLGLFTCAYFVPNFILKNWSVSGQNMHSHLDNNISFIFICCWNYPFLLFLSFFLFSSEFYYWCWKFPFLFTFFANYLLEPVWQHFRLFISFLFYLKYFLWRIILLLVPQDLYQTKESKLKSV